MVSKKIVLHFPKRLVDRPIVYHLIKDHSLEFNILKASVTPEQEGLMVLELKGKQEDYDKGIHYLTGAGVIIESLSQNVLRNEERCTHCGACITVCPVGAFELDMASRKTKFYDKKCIACGLCIKACPPRAMELHF
ncbi:MAG: 4Fe-4S binding protein [Chloroflexi bacterium]|nr:4Fe-4S binding protein [Chloroflexota bacterium]